MSLEFTQATSCFLGVGGHPERWRLSPFAQESDGVELPGPSPEELPAASRSRGGRLGLPLPPGGGDQDSSSEGDSDVYEDCEEDAWLTCSEDEAGGAGPLREQGPCEAGIQRPFRNSSHLVARDELLEILKAAHTGKTVRDGEVTVGLVSWSNCYAGASQSPTP